MEDSIFDNFAYSGIYGLITTLHSEDPLQDNQRIKAYNLLKAGLKIAKKSKSVSLNLLPTIAFELSRHESIYRMSALLSLELCNTDKALEYLAYLHHYFNEKDATPHDQYQIIRKNLIEQGVTEKDIDISISNAKEQYEHEKILNNIKEYSEILPTDDLTEQKTYFRRIYRKFGLETVLTAVKSDNRFKDREKAVLLIRASRAVGAIANEGPSVESKFADIALELDTSDTVIKNVFQAYLRAGDINKITQLKQQYPEVLDA